MAHLISIDLSIQLIFGIHQAEELLIIEVLHVLFHGRLTHLKMPTEEGFFRLFFLDLLHVVVLFRRALSTTFAIRTFSMPMSHPLADGTSAVLL